MSPSDASIDNLERLSRCIDTGFLKDQSHKESINKHAMANKVVDEQFWSYVERLAGLLSSGILTTDEDHQQQIHEKIEALLRTGESQSISQDQIIWRELAQGNIIFPVQLTTNRIGNLTRWIYTLLYGTVIHTYIHAYAYSQAQKNKIEQGK